MVDTEYSGEYHFTTHFTRAVSFEESGSGLTMLFSPLTERRRLQLRISERRLLLMAGDMLAVILAVLIALRIWALVAREPFTIEFVWPRSYWFIVLTGVWLLLAAANDFYDLRVTSRRSSMFQRLIVINLQMLVLHPIVFFLARPLALPRLFILYYAVASFAIIGVFRLLNPAVSGWVSSKRRVLIVGTDSAVKPLSRSFSIQQQMSTTFAA